MRKLLLPLITLTVFIGITGFALNFVFGNGVVTYITTESYNGITVYKYDFYQYVNNIQNSFQSTIQLQLNIPNTEWQQIVDLQTFWHNIANVFNFVIMGLNIIIYPIRILFYGIRIVLAIIGLPVGLPIAEYVENPLGWLITIVNNAITIQIPYIQA